MIPLRLLLGLFEAGYFPGALYLISTWYVRYDIHKRYSVFYLIGCVAAALSGILAYGLMQMNGLGNYSGWRWIFIMQGIITVVIGFIGYFTLVDFPDRAAQKHKHFLTERECQFVMRKIAADRDDVEAGKFDFKLWAAGGADMKVWGFALIFFGITTTSYAISYFLPIILLSMGFSVAEAQCLVAPP